MINYDKKIYSHHLNRIKRKPVQLDNGDVSMESFSEKKDHMPLQ